MKFIGHTIFGIFDVALLFCVFAGLLTALYVAFKVWFGVDISIFYKAVFHLLFQV